MTRFKLIAACLLLLPSFCFAGNIDTVKSKLAGKWLLVKHMMNDRGKPEDLLTPDYIYTYDFRNDGTYTVTYNDRKNSTVTVIDGKWKFLSNNTKIRLYDNNQEGDTHLISDTQLPVIRLNDKEFVTKELLFGMDLLGTSYYKREF